MNQAFLGLVVLAVILWGHGLYTWKQADKPEMTQGAKVLLIVTAVLTGIAVIVGIVGILCHLDSTMVHAMGLITLLLSLWANYQIRHVCGK